MAATRKLTVEVLGDARSAHGTFKALADGTDNLGRQFIDFGKKAAVAFTAVAAGTAVFAKKALDAAYEAQRVSAQTEAIVRTTGKAAGVSAAEVQRLADALSFKTGVDDEAIQSSMNMLLAFKQVRNEAGRGNDVFTRASAAMLDLANVFGSVDGAAMQLGKALSDPVKGITALRRAGVTFTEAQQQQIKTLARSGDLLSAQRIILSQVESQVGGTAAATATAAARMRIAFENLQEKIGALLMPAFEGFARVMTDDVIPAIQRLVDTYGERLTRFFTRLWSSIKNVTATVSRTLQPVLKRIGDWMSRNTGTVATFFSVLAGAAVLASIAAVAAGIAGLFNPVTLLVAAVAAAAAGIVHAYKNFDTFRQVVDSVARFLTGTVGPALARVFRTLADTIASLVDGIRTRWADISAATANIFDAITAQVRIAAAVLQRIWDVFGAAITASVTRAWNATAQTVRGALDVIKGVLDIFLGILSGHWGRAWDGLKSVVSGTLQTVLGVVKAMTNPIITAFALIWAGIKKAATAPFNALVWLVRTTMNTVVDLINRFIDIWNRIQFTAPRIHIPGTDWTIGGFTIGLPDLTKIPHLEQGGIVTSPSIVQIAEHEPEAVIPLSRLTNGDTNVTIHVSGADPNAVVDALKRYYRQNGAVPIRTLTP